MIKKYGRWFLAEPDDADGGGKGTAIFDGEPQPGVEQEEDKTKTGEEDKEKEKETPAAPVVNATELAEKFGEQLAKAFPKPTAPEKPMSKEEADELLQVWKPTKEWITKFDNLETRETALAEMRDGVVRNADMVAQFRIKAETDKIVAKYDPVLQFVAQEQERQQTERFGKKYEQLADPALKPFLDAVKKELDGTKFKNEDEHFDAIANGVVAVIRVSNPDFKLSAGSSPADKGKGKGSSSGGIPVTTPGAGGGTVTKKVEAPAKRGLAIFDS